MPMGGPAVARSESADSGVSGDGLDCSGTVAYSSRTVRGGRLRGSKRGKSRGAAALHSEWVTCHSRCLPRE